MDLEYLLLSGSGRIGRGRFLVGIIALAVYAALSVMVFRVPEGAFCEVDAQALMGRIYFAALALMGLVGAVMLMALGAKRLADMGWPEWLAALVALGVLAGLLALRLEALGPCGAMTAQRLPIVAGAAGLLVLLLVVGLVWPGRRPKPAVPQDADDPTRMVGL
ncbi:DUF805 domain-containing protein [Amorphus sp. MBR-141]